MVKKKVLEKIDALKKKKKLSTKEWFILQRNKLPIGKPESFRTWTTIYYGWRGSGKTLHQSRETMNVLRYFDKLYSRKPYLNKAILYTNQHLSQPVLDKYGQYIYHFDELDEIKYCPRKKCWRGKKQHMLHGCILVFDDVSVMLDPRNWPYTPDWLKKYFTLGRHFGIHILASLVDPLAVDVAFRRTIELAYQFTKIVGSPDPDETQPPVRWIFGIYRRRRIDAKNLFRTGDLPEQTIRLQLIDKEEEEKQLKEEGRELDIVYDDSWKGSYHMFNKTGRFLMFGRWGFKPIASTEIYDTLQNVHEFVPKGFLCTELRCLEKDHIHPWDFPEVEVKELKKNPKFCDYTRKIWKTV